MSKHNARRKSDLKYLDLSNIIKSPESEEVVTRRFSKRIVRKSILSTDSDRKIEIPKQSRRRKSTICKQYTNPILVSTDYNSSSVISTSDHEDYSNNNTIPITEIESPPKSESIPHWLMQIYKPTQYIPPHNKGLSTLTERIFKQHPNRVNSQKTEKQLLRRQIFTGQTLEEACTPCVPGVAPLEPDVILSLTRKRLLSRQRKAKKLGFKGISISKKTEASFVKFMTKIQSLDSSLSPV